MNNSLLNKALLNISAILLFFVLCILAFYPTHYVDEGLYIGAAVQVLKGDILLANYWFDKPFMQFLWIIPGIIFLGANTLGFCFSAIMASVYSLRLFPKCLPNSSSLSGILIALLFFANPFHLSFMASSMAEPFLLLSILLSIHYLFKFFNSQNPKDRFYSAIWFALGFCTKQSIFMILPMYIALLVPKDYRFKDIITSLKSFLWDAKLVWIIALFYQISNEKKLAAITWFSKLAKPRVSHSFAEHIIYWSKQFYLTQRSHLLAWIIIILVIGYAIYILKKIKTTNFQIKKIKSWRPEDLGDIKLDLMVFMVPLLLHWIGLSLSNAKHAERYMFIFNIQLYLMLIRIFFLTPKKGQFIATPILSIILLIKVFNYQWEELDPSRKKGETLFKSQYIIPQDSIVHTRLKWQIYPFENNYFLESCQDEDCIDQKGRGLQSQQYQYLIEKSEPFNMTHILPKNYKRLERQEQKIKSNIWKRFKKRIRLNNDFKIESVERTQEINPKRYFNIQQDSERWDLVLASNQVKIDLELIPVVSLGKQNKEFGLEDQAMLGLLIDEAKISYGDYKFNALTLLDFILKTLVIPIDTIDSNGKRIDFLKIENPSTFSYQEITLAQ